MTKVVRKRGPAKARLERVLQQAATYQARVGFLEGAAYGEKGPPLAYVAVIHENGVAEKNIPARPFFGPTVDRNRERWRQACIQGAKMLMAGAMSFQQFLQQIGEDARLEVQRSIEAVNSPVLAESTIFNRDWKRRTGRGDISSLTKPLEESRHMLDHVASVVEKAR